MTGVSRAVASHARKLAPFLVAVLLLVPGVAHADIGADISAFFGGIVDCASDVGACALGAITSPIAIVSWIIFKIASVLLGVAGMLFNWVMLALVFEFARYLGNSEGMLLAWSILRDFANIGLLFGFLFLGIATILDLHSYPWKKTLPMLIIYAVLLNFSLFISQAVIDVANVVSATLYRTGFEIETCTTSAERDNTWLECAINGGVASAFLERTRIATSLKEEYSAGSFIEGARQQITNPLGNILQYIVLALLVSVAAVVLFAASFMFISRAVVLAFLMVTSPIGFAGMAIPGLKKLADDWWDKLIKQAFFAPIFLLLLLVALKLTEGLAAIGGSGGLGSAITSGAVNSGPFLMFALVTGFFIGALMIADKFGIYASEWATKTAGGFVGGTVLGGAAWAGRNTLGKYANRVANRLNTTGYMGLKSSGYFGRQLAGVAKYGATASFDTRSASPVKATLKGIGLDLGKPSKDAQKGYRGITDASNKAKAQKAKDRQDAWKQQDATYENAIKSHTRDAGIADARAREALEKAKQLRDSGDTAGAERYLRYTQGFRKTAQEQRAHAENVQKEWTDKKRARLTEDERVVNDYKKGAADRMDERAEETDAAAEPAREAFKAAASEVKAAADEMKAAATALKDAQAAHRSEATDASREALRVATEARDAARTREERALIEQETARVNRDSADRLAATVKARAASLGAESTAYEKTVFNPKNALEQVATSYERLASIDRSNLAAGIGSRVVRTVLDADRLMAARNAIRSDAGKSELDSTLEHLKHAIEHGGGHHDDHAEDHAPKPKAKSGGEGGGGEHGGGGAPLH